MLCAIMSFVALLLANDAILLLDLCSLLVVLDMQYTSVLAFVLAQLVGLISFLCQPFRKIRSLIEEQLGLNARQCDAYGVCEREARTPSTQHPLPRPPLTDYERMFLVNIRAINNGKVTRSEILGYAQPSPLPTNASPKSTPSRHPITYAAPPQSTPPTEATKPFNLSEYRETYHTFRTSISKNSLIRDGRVLVDESLIEHWIYELALTTNLSHEDCRACLEASHWNFNSALVACKRIQQSVLLARATGMTFSAAEMCLASNGWEFLVAMQDFRELRAEGRIPDYFFSAAIAGV